jgi:hypothetical protein
VWLGDLVQAVLYAVVDRDANFTAPIMQKVRSVGGRGWRNCARFMISLKRHSAQMIHQPGFQCGRAIAFHPGVKSTCRMLMFSSQKKFSKHSTTSTRLFSGKYDTQSTSLEP